MATPVFTSTNDVLASFEKSAEPSLRDSEVLLQARHAVGEVQQNFDVSEPEAKKAVVVLAAYETVRQGGNAEDALQKYPEPLKEYLEYTPGDLKFNQTLTKVGSVITVVGLALAIGAALYAAGAAALVLLPATPLLIKLMGDPAAVQRLAAYVQGLRFLVSRAVVKPAIISAGAGAVAAAANYIVNNWNDVFHWGKTYLSQERKNLEQLKAKTGIDGFTQFGSFKPEGVDFLFSEFSKGGAQGIANDVRQVSQAFTRETFTQSIEDIIGRFNATGKAPTPAEVLLELSRWVVVNPSAATVATFPAALPGAAGAAVKFPSSGLQPLTRLTMSTSTKPILLLGTIFAQRLKSMEAFERNKDDQINSVANLQTDASLELNNWLKTLPGRLSYTIELRSEPYDENGIKRPGVWATLNLSHKGIGGKNTYLDNILLGPVDPQVYMPKASDLSQVQFQLPKLLTAEEIAQIAFPSDGLNIVDKTGNLVPVTLAPSAPLPKVSPPSAPALVRTPEEETREALRLKELVAVEPKPQVSPPPPTFSSASPVPKYQVAGPAGIFELANNQAATAYTSYPAGVIWAGGSLLRITDVNKASAGYVRISPELLNVLTPTGDYALPAEQPAAQIQKATPQPPAVQPSTQSGRIIHVNIAKLMVRAQPTGDSETRFPHFLQNGSVFEAVGSAVGQSVAGVNAWWITREGYYIWSGGTLERP